VTNSELIKKLSSRLGITQNETRKILLASAKVLQENIDHDLGVSIPGLGTFTPEVHQSRKSFNPFYKKFMRLPPKRVVKFHSCSSLKKELKNFRI